MYACFHGKIAIFDVNTNCIFCHPAIKKIYHSVTQRYCKKSTPSLVKIFSIKKFREINIAITMQNNSDKMKVIVVEVV